MSEVEVKSPTAEEFLQAREKREQEEASRPRSAWPEMVAKEKKVLQQAVDAFKFMENRTCRLRLCGGHGGGPESIPDAVLTDRVREKLEAASYEVQLSFFCYCLGECHCKPEHFEYQHEHDYTIPDVMMIIRLPTSAEMKSKRKREDICTQGVMTHVGSKGALSL